MTDLLVTPRMTAVVEGSISNHVKIVGRNGGRSRGRRPPKKRAATRIAPRSYRKANDTKGDGVLVRICVSYTPAELARLDAMAARCQMSRSEFIRKAVLHFGAKLFPEGETP